MTQIEQPDTTPSLANNERFMKRLVIVLGILLIAGFVVLIAGIALRVAKRGSEDTVAAEIAPATAFVNAQIKIPEGATISNMTATDDRLYLHLTGSDGRQTILVVDARTSAVVGTLSLSNE